MDQKKKPQRQAGFTEMEAMARTILLQAGRQTPPDALLWELDFVEGTSAEAKRLDTEFIGGGVASFVLISVTRSVDISALAKAIYQHIGRLKRKGDDDLIVLVGGRITSNKEEVNFKDVRCRTMIPLKGKSQEEVEKTIREAIAEAG
jgi:hypothetical protein